MNRLHTIDFHGTPLMLVDWDGQPFVAMKAVTEGMGLAWQPQQTKLKADSELWGYQVIVIPSAGGPQEMGCIPLEHLHGWLFGIQASRVKKEVRESLRTYQKECFQVLKDYWTKGVAMNPRAQVHMQVPQTLQEALRAYADALDHNQTLSCKVEAQSEEIRILEPMAAVAEAITNVQDAQSFDQAAKVLGTGPIRLFNRLREWKWIKPHSTLPYQEYVDNGFLTVKEVFFTDAHKVDRISTKTFITGKGLVSIQKRMASESGAMLVRPQHQV